jgi:hypothetical protein
MISVSSCGKTNPMSWDRTDTWRVNAYVAKHTQSTSSADRRISGEQTNMKSVYSSWQENSGEPVFGQLDHTWSLMDFLVQVLTCDLLAFWNKLGTRAALKVHSVLWTALKWENPFWARMRVRLWLKRTDKIVKTHNWRITAAFLYALLTWCMRNEVIDVVPLWLSELLE